MFAAFLIDFNQHLGAAAPKRWTKYTTSVIRVSQYTFGDDVGVPLKNFLLLFLSSVVQTFVTENKSKMFGNIHKLSRLSRYAVAYTHILYVSKFTVSYFLILRGCLVVEVDSKIYTQQSCRNTKY